MPRRLVGLPRTLRWLLVGLGCALALAACGGPGKTGGGKAHVHVASQRAGRGASGLFPPGPYAAVMIDNAPQARPQAGLDRAALVYELLAEGGITRYLAFFPVREHIPAIGPVRSARIGFIDIDEAYGIPYAHAGGNVDALAALSRGVLPNLDEIYGSPAFFWRSSSRQAPHNLYTSSALLARAIAERHLPQRDLRPWPLGPAPAGLARASQLTIVYAWQPPVYTYTVSWRWDGQRYLRSIDGSPDVSADGQRVAAGDVVVLHVASVPDPDPYTPGAVKYMLTQGDGWLFRDGEEEPISWSFSPQDGFSFTHDGQAAAFAPGPVWVEVVPPSLQPEVR
jgi:hypothetical protein